MGGHSKFKTSIRRREPSTPSDCGPSSIHSLGIHVIVILFQFTAKCPSPIPRSPRGVGQAKVRLPRHVRPHLDCSSDRCVPAPLGSLVGLLAPLYFGCRPPFAPNVAPQFGGTRIPCISVSYLLLIIRFFSASKTRLKAVHKMHLRSLA